MGVTHFHIDTKIVGSTTSLRIERKGTSHCIHTSQENEEVDAGAIIGGLLIWSLSFDNKYKPVHNYELKPLNYYASISESALSSGEYYISGVLKD